MVSFMPRSLGRCGRAGIRESDYMTATGPSERKRHRTFGRDDPAAAVASGVACARTARLPGVVGRCAGGRVEWPWAADYVLFVYTEVTVGGLSKLNRQATLPGYPRRNAQKKRRRTFVEQEVIGFLIQSNGHQ